MSILSILSLLIIILLILTNKKIKIQMWTLKHHFKLDLPLGGPRQNGAVKMGREKMESCFGGRTKFRDDKIPPGELGLKCFWS